MTGKRGYSTGDINLAAALMTIGIPPRDVPVRIIAADDGHNYISYRLSGEGIAGESTSEAMSMWTTRAANGDSPFGWIMAFCSEKPKNTGPSIDAWTQHLAEWLAVSYDSARQLVGDAKNVAAASPESETSYLVAFVANREFLKDLATSAIKHGKSIVNFMRHDSGFSFIPEKAPRHVRDFLMSQS